MQDKVGCRHLRQIYRPYHRFQALIESPCAWGRFRSRDKCLCRLYNGMTVGLFSQIFELRTAAVVNSRFRLLVL